MSCSNCTDYQARDLDIRYGRRETDENGRKLPIQYVHMLNSTLCACTRAICCILENWQTDTGIKVPEPLVPYLNGMTEIPFVRDDYKRKDDKSK